MTTTGEGGEREGSSISRKIIDLVPKSVFDPRCDFSAKQFEYEGPFYIELYAVYVYH